MTFRIDKTFRFSAAHFLQGLPETHQCARLHGHNYEVKIILEADGLNEVGFVRDYGELDKFKEWLDLNFDHRLLNDLEQFIGNPTAEHMAHAIYEVAATMYPEVTAIGVSETPSTWAYWMPQVIPAADRVLLSLEQLADEPFTNRDRQRLQTALNSLFGPPVADPMAKYFQPELPPDYRTEPPGSPELCSCNGTRQT